MSIKRALPCGSCYVPILTLFCLVISLGSTTARNDFDCKVTEYKGFMKKVCTNTRGDEFFECFDGNLFYETFHFHQLCPEDPNFYQLCGLSDAISANFDNRLDDMKIEVPNTLCGEFLCVTDDYVTHFGSYWLERIKCDNVADCINTSIDEMNCGSEESSVEGKDYRLLSTGFKLEEELFCNDVCDVPNCEDEARCNGYRYGLFCETIAEGWGYINPTSICDESIDCRKGIDEKNCEVDDSLSMSDGNAECNTMRYTSFPHAIRLRNSMRCAVPKESRDAAICANFIEQTNCSDSAKIAFSCPVRGYNTTISKYMVCRDAAAFLCDDFLENTCESVTPACYIHKHRICDGSPNCSDLGDENDAFCGAVTVKTCTRRGRPGSNLPIPISWLMDGFVDCVYGEDEMGEIWATCGSGIGRRFVSEGHPCQDVFLCQDGFVEFTFLCDGVESCGSENHVCSVSRSFPDIYTKLEVYEGKAGVSPMIHCVKGLSSLLQLRGDVCVESTFKHPDHEVFGFKGRSLKRPLGPRSCDHLYGESYVFMSCSRHGCENSKCPLNDDFPHHDSCPTQLEQRIKTRAKGSKDSDTAYLTFLNRRRGLYTNEYFVCDQQLKCIPYSKVCDLISDCNDKSDEANCTNHFKCTSYNQFIPKTQKCDGNSNCLDLSDECNDECSKELLDSSMLKIVAWCFGIAATLFNAVALMKNLKSVLAAGNYRALSNRVYLSLINLGDLMIGVYLLILALMDASYSDRYCHDQTCWLTHMNCSLLGIFNTIGSLISIISMAVLSVIRVKTVYSSSMHNTVSVSKKNVAFLITQILLVLLVSACIAAVPLSPHAEDFFVNGQFYDPSEKLFIGFPDKDDHLNVITRYYGRMQRKTLKWKVINELVAGMFSREYGGLQKKKLDFYGNDGTCMFKYFVKSSDPQKEFVWSSLLFNLTCFVIITTSYIAISAMSKNTTASLGQRFRKRNQATQRKITAIIVSDCFCWFPFIFVCIFHSIEVLDATQWYSVFSVMILPLNSVINPLLYNDTVLANRIRSAVGRICHHKVRDEDVHEMSQPGQDKPRDGGLDKSPLQRSNKLNLATSIPGQDNMCSVELGR